MMGAANNNDPRWKALLGCWLAGAGVIRCKHLERSTPRRLSLSTIHFRCGKGRTATALTGRSLFCAPTAFSGHLSGWRIGGSYPLRSSRSQGCALTVMGQPFLPHKSNRQCGMPLSRPWRAGDEPLDPLVEEAGPDACHAHAVV